jgi:hypothetical protein
LILARRIEEVRQAKIFGVRPQRSFREAATKFLEENVHLRSIGDYAMHLKQLDPYIGDLPLERLHLGSLQGFIEARKRAGIKNRSINLTLATVRRVLNLAARLWRDEAGLTWLDTPPLMQKTGSLQPPVGLGSPGTGTRYLGIHCSGFHGKKPGRSLGRPEPGSQIDSQRLEVHAQGPGFHVQR